MEEKRIGVIGVGGKTGTMFAFELRKTANILGIGKEIEEIKRKKLFIKRKGNPPELFEEKVVLDSQFSHQEFLPEIIFLTIKNPVNQVVKYYYQKIKDYNLSTNRKLPLPTLVLSQNGISAGEDALAALKEVFGQNYKKIRVIRLILLNPILEEELNDKICINYSLPIQICFGKISGPGDLRDIAAIFEKANFEAKEYFPKEIKNLEYSKLFLNLIGMACASRGFPINQGLKNSEIFKEEIEALREYIRIIQVLGGNFLNLPRYPSVKFFTFLIGILPINSLSFFKNYFIKLISEGKEGKPKDLTEIEYYNGAVVSLGKKIGISAPINQKILERCTEFG